ncbi:MAG: hypothetical protein CVU69_08000 [Deltaproteobacteria bacterium HGW-Deltaproteobacteria-4]|nr:MAG: hypothetical protein CVU69_08000 [Deltaproteobacteria bacterium HGW-Deltaproteobacteria-4]
MKILIVDDNADDRNILRHYLAHVASVLLEAVNGAEGLTMAGSERPDLIISDALMPNVDGFEFLREIRRSTELCHTPFIFYSAVYTGSKEQELALSLGADAFMVKPLEAEEFLSQLRNLLASLDRTQKRPGNELLEEDEKFLRKYSQIVAARLEEKVVELETLQQTLEARVVELVAEQRRKDQILLQQNRLAALGEMINNIAHQWRNPLNNIALIIQNLRMDFDAGTLTPKGLHDDIDKAMKVILYMSQTINDFSNFFREDKKKDEFSINKAVERVLEMVAATLKCHKIEVEIKNGDEVTAIGYPNEYAQVLLNIISNARETCIERRVAAPCLFIRIFWENERSVVSIRDNCGGIPDDILPRIFDPYFTTRGPERGTGIGLYMAKVIIEQNMGGSLTAGNIDHGAEFRIVL